jgi:EAL domain-containing protein (putative c-di-GMP-specific phosphodiesterase class I)
VATLDILVLRKALTTLGEMVQHDQRAVLIVPIHYSTLNMSKARDRYLRLCHAVPAKLRNYLVYEVIPQGNMSWNTNLQEYSSMLRRFGRSVSCRVGLNFSHFEELKGLGFQAVGFSLEDASLPDKAALGAIETFAKHTRKFGLRCYVHGLTSPERCVAAIKSGYSYIDGSAFGGAVSSPNTAQLTQSFG